MVKLSYLETVKGELKQYQKRRKQNYDFFSSSDYGNIFLNQKEKVRKPVRKCKQFFKFFFPNHIQIFKKMIEYGLAWQYQL